MSIIGFLICTNSQILNLARYIGKHVFRSHARMKRARGIMQIHIPSTDRNTFSIQPTAKSSIHADRNGAN